MTQADVRRATVASLIGRLLLSTAVIAGFAACSRTDATPILTADMPLHLEDHLDAATVTGSEVSTDLYQPVEWRFDQPQAEWALTPQPRIGSPTLQPSRITLEYTADALRVTLPEENRRADNLVYGGLYVDLPAWRREEWAHIIVRARTSGVTDMSVGLNVGSDPARGTFARSGGSTPLVSDGSVQTYQIRPNWGNAGTGPWGRLGLGFSATEPGSIDLLSVSVVPTAALYADRPHDVREVAIGERIRRTLVMHAPGSLAYAVRVPEQARLDLSLGTLTVRTPVTYAVTATAPDGDVETVFEERYADPDRWGQRSVDLAKFAGQTVTLTLAAQAAEPGTVALWGAPTVSGVRGSDKPNVILYIIDGGGADQMSVYGYNRRTTPNLERLAAQGAVFEHAYSNSGDTRLSTPSFMTSLQFSVLGAPNQFESLPAQARTMADRFHEARYSTAVFTSNANAGTISSLERGVDVFRDVRATFNWRSSEELHENFWDWREDFPGEPYWVHFQTTDVHGPSNQVPGQFEGLFAGPEGRARFEQWDGRLREWRDRNQGEGDERRQFTETGIDRIQYYNLRRSFYDERMAHQDHQLGRFVARLQQTGQWENTLLVIAADHGIESANGDFLVPLSDHWPPDELWTVLRSSVSRVPLLFIWPGRIPGGQRFSHAVSMIDVMPTLLDLAELPAAEVQQGQSLAPLLLGHAGWQPRPVVFDEFDKDPRTGELRGQIEMIDGRWGASLWIGAPDDPLQQRPTPLLLFDVWNDPLAVQPINQEHPDLVAKYTRLLEQQWAAHRLLARRFTTGGEMQLTPAQLETLRSLGYIR